MVWVLTTVVVHWRTRSRHLSPHRIHLRRLERCKCIDSNVRTKHQYSYILWDRKRLREAGCCSRGGCWKIFLSYFFLFGFLGKQTSVREWERGERESLKLFKKRGRGWGSYRREGEEGRKKMMSSWDHVVGCFGRGLVVFTSLSAWSDPLHRESMLYGAGRTVGLAWFNPSFGIKKWIHIAYLHSWSNFIMFWCIL